MADTNVKLDIRAPGYWYQTPGSDPGNGEPPAGWTKSPTQPTFIYKYSGGNTPADDGSWKFTVEHSASGKTIGVDLITAAGGAYKITDVGISYDGATPPPGDQLGVDKKNDRKWEITDPDHHQEAGGFNVTVSYTPNGGKTTTGIECDPKWENEA